MTSSFKSQSDLLTALPGLIYSFEGATLKATSPDPTATNKQVATTEWVKGVLGIAPTPPTVLDAGGLNITYTTGTVINSITSTPIEVEGVTTPIAVGASSIEYVWVRYLDGAVIASSSAPSNNQGYLLATVTTNATEVVSITPNASTVGWAPIHSPSFSGTVTVPSPALMDNSNKAANTSWVRAVVHSTLLGSAFPTLSITNTGDGVIWSSGEVMVAGTVYPVLGGQYTFTSDTNGMVHVYAVVVTTSTIVVVTPTSPSTANVLLGSISVSGGKVGQVSLPPTSGFAPLVSPTFTGNPQAPTPGTNDRDNSIATTGWVIDTVTTKMVVGFGGYVTYLDA